MGFALDLTADASPPASASQGRALQARRDAAAAFAAVLELPRPEGIMAAMRSMAPNVPTNIRPGRCGLSRSRRE